MEDLFNVCEKDIFTNVKGDDTKKVCEIIASEFVKNLNEILEANEKDIKMMKRANMSENIIKSLVLDKSEVYQVCSYINDIGNKPLLNDIIYEKKSFNSLSIKKINNPIGKIAVVYDIDLYIIIIMSIMCIKSGNYTTFISLNRVLNTHRLMIRIIRECLSSINFSNDIIKLSTVSSDNEIINIINSKKHFDSVIFYGLSKKIENIKKNCEVDFMTLKRNRSCIYIDTYSNEVINILSKIDRFENVSDILIDKTVYNYIEDKINNVIFESLNVKKVESVNEAIKYINNLGYIISSFIFSENENTICKFKEQVLSNYIYINKMESFMFNISDNLKKRFFVINENFHREIIPDIIMRSKYIIE